MSLNHFLLHTFAPDTLIGSDINAIQTRYQTVSKIYICSIQIMLFALYKACDYIFLPLPGAFILIVSVPLLFLSLLLIIKRHKTLAAFTTLVAFQAATLIGSVVYDMSIAAIIFSGFFPGLGFLITSSSKVHLINFVFYSLQNCVHLLKVQHAFQNKLWADRDSLFVSMQVVAFCTFISHFVHDSLRKYIEDQLLEQAQASLTKAENINKDLVQALSAKDVFISSLSHEIRNPLNSIKCSIDYLVSVVQNQQHLKILKTAQISGEVLLTLLTNLLDAAKLKAEKMDLANSQINPIEHINKIIVINTENMKRKSISGELHVFEAIPSSVWIDPGRFSQILINLMSNAIKFTEEHGAIKIFMKWYPEGTDETVLTQPLESDPFRHNVQILQGSRNINAIRLTTNNSMRVIVPPQEENIREESSREMSSQQMLEYKDKFKYLKGHKTNDLTQLNLSSTLLDEEQPLWKIVNRRSPSLYVANGTSTSQSLASNSGRGYLKIQISDNGCGIPSDVIPKLFSMFAQSRTVIAKKNEGAGIGLWLSKQLCRKMGGDIALYSTENQGTSFVFYFSVSTINPYSSPSSEGPQHMRRTSKKIHVLIVDDHHYNRDLHKLILEQEGVVVTLASDGSEAVSRYKENSDGYFDFILMDIQMPIMDGFAATKVIRDFEVEHCRRRTKICFVSGEYYDEKDLLTKLKAHRLGSETGIKCLKKPVDIDELKRMVGEVSQ